jgi:hypothetical protein
MQNREQAIGALNAAIARVDYLKLCSGPLEDSHELERRRRDLAIAEETRSTAAFRILQLDADAMAAELLDLERRRVELLARVHGFLTMDGHGALNLRCTRTMSAALLSQQLRSEQPDQDVKNAAAEWRRRLDALLAGRINDGAEAAALNG